ncbi:hypothetical protein N0B31_04460 [Salinirubellus salinus]|jgi:hypothetical protein|uniref:Uncharacterized protein n=1 Tax=Salinirubellus salinus TaxID=1364945 RepID=A0A9E7R5F0_9EURY|nr:hypothetical protein [Salinirubellus salinus]UWM55539.1 hypothetical protein N0B31_04460 [Salinirubellus salinus]
MARVPITETVLDQLRDVIAAESIQDPIARYDVQAVAFDREHDELVEFIASADASTYFEAVSKVTDVSTRS